jgi:hypothetical protein
MASVLVHSCDIRLWRRPWSRIQCADRHLFGNGQDLRAW